MYFMRIPTFDFSIYDYNFSLSLKSAPLILKHPNPKILLPTKNQKTLTFFVPYLQRFTPISNGKKMINFSIFIVSNMRNRNVKVKQRPQK